MPMMCQWQLFGTPQQANPTGPIDHHRRGLPAGVPVRPEIVDEALKRRQR